MHDHLAGLIKVQDEKNQELGRLVAIKEILQWANRWKDSISQPALDSLIDTTERLRHAPPS